MYEADDKDTEFTHTPQSNSICRQSLRFFFSPHSLSFPLPPLSPLSLLPKQREKMSKIPLKNNDLHLLSFFSHSLLLAFVMTSLEKEKKKPGPYLLCTDHQSTIPGAQYTHLQNAHPEHADAYNQLRCVVFPEPNSIHQKAGLQV